MGKRMITPEDLDGPMMVWPRTPLSAEGQKAWNKWKAERKAAWLTKISGKIVEPKK